MEFSEIKNKPETELRELLASSRDQARHLNFQVSEKQLKNVRALRVVRKTISRILTALNTLAHVAK